jgi:predicted RNA-binding Zn ribbon-like protein
LITSDQDKPDRITGQVKLDRYADAGVVVSVQLVNALAPADPGGEPQPREQALRAIAKILAFDAPSLAQLRSTDRPGFQALARSLRLVFQDFERRDVNGAASRLNELLSRSPAHPHLAKERGRWRLHHHPMDIALLPMCTAICAEALARMLGAGHADRFGTCQAPGCDRVFFDVSKNGSRRFCSTTCQNRVKAAAFRLRRGGSRAPSRVRRGRRGLTNVR